MLLPKITVLLGTTYRDIHAEREQLLKRTLPELRREFAEQGVLLAVREVKWSPEPKVLTRQLEEFFERVRDESTYYLGIRSQLQPHIPAPISLDANVPMDLRALVMQRVQAGISWQELELVLLDELNVVRKILLANPSEYPAGSNELTDSLERELRSIAALVASQGAATYHELYLANRSEQALGSASRAGEILSDLESTSVVVVGDTGSGKSTSIALALQQLTQEGRAAIPYVLDGRDTSGSTIAEYLQGKLGSQESPSSGPLDLAILLSRANELVVALDGVEYLDEGSKYLGWLPNPLPKGVRVIVSTTLQEQADALEARGWSIVNSNVLSQEQIRALIDHLSDVRHVWLSDLQKEQIANHPLAFHHQFIITVLDELAQFGWYGQLHRNLDDHLDELSIHELYTSAIGDAASDSQFSNSIVLAVRLKNYLDSHSLVELYQKVLERLEFDFGAVHLTRVLGFLAVSLRGLTSNDLAAITTVPEQTIRHLVNALGENVNTRAGRFSIGNEYFAQAVRTRYHGSKSVMSAVRSSLVIYLRTKTEEAYLEELCGQLILARDTNALKELLLDVQAVSHVIHRVPITVFANWWRATGEISAVQSLYLSRLPQIEKLPIELRIHVLRQLAEFFLFLGNPGGALEMLSAGLRAQEEVASHLSDRASILRSLGRTYYLLARYPDSEQAYRDSIDVYAQLGDEHLNESRAVTHDLAKLLAEGARFDAADELFTRLILQLEGSHGQDSAELAPVLNSIGLMLNAQGRYDAAITVAARARNLYVNHWGRDYPELGWSYHVFATAYRQKGDLDEAQRWYEAAIERFTQMYGEEHPIPLRSKYGLAVLLQRKGDIPGAIEQGREVVALREKLLGPTHADSAAAYVMLGGMLKSAGDYDEAVQLLEKGLAIFDNGANKEHPEVARTLHELGEVYILLGKPAEARDALDRAFTMRSKVLGSDHQDTIATSSLLNSLPPISQEVQHSTLPAI